MNRIKVGLLGLGTVGSSVWTVLARNADEIARRAGRRIEITRIAVRNPAKDYPFIEDKSLLCEDPYAVVRDPHIHIIVEVIGGLDPARELVLAAIAQGKHVVTANKALLARYGNEIFAAALKKGVTVAFEAAIGGGIPIIKAIREGLSANCIQWVAGIINGTTNFILSQMRRERLSFEQALSQAQQLGYAEVDPTFDIEGIDTAHKLSLLTSLAFGVPVQCDKAYMEGITELTQADIVLAEQLGYRIKLLGMTKRRAEGIELRVHPTLIPKDQLLSSVEGAMNAVLIQGDVVGATLYYGQGAGGEPTASSIIADLVDLTRLDTADPNHRVPHLAFQPNAMSDMPILPIEQVKTSYYLRLRVTDRPGVLADLARLLADFDISIGSMIQQSCVNAQADIIFLTHEAIEGKINQAIMHMQSCEFVLSKVTRLRIENLMSNLS